MAKNSFILYHDQKEVIDELDDEQAGKLIKAIYEYNVNKKLTLTGALKLVFIPFKNSFDRNDDKWDDIVKKRSEAGKKGMEKRWKNEQNITNDNKCYQTITNITDSVSVSVSDSVSDSDNDSDLKKENTKRKVFTKPTVEEVKAYCAERKNNVNPDKFIDFYESKGWLIGKNPMKDWRACVRTWEKGGSSPPNKPSSVYVNPTQKEFDDLSGFYAN